jgi:predicted dehydrogenase
MGVSPIRVGVIGAGWWAAENHLPVLKESVDVEISGICGLEEPQLRRLCDHFGIPFATADYRELIALPGLSAVIVSSPHHLHFEHARAALEAGLHVLCEKPMCLRSEEAHSLRDCAKRRRLHFLIPYAWNYTDLADDAEKQVRLGAIGTPVHVLCHMASALADLFSGEGAWFADAAIVKPNLHTWSDPAIGGGFAHGQLTHALGLLFRLMDSPAVEVYCSTYESRTGADLCLSIACRFANGASGSISGAGVLPPGSPFQVDLRVFGTDGTLLLDIERPRVEVRRLDGRNVRINTSMTPGAYPQAEPVRVFLGLVRGDAVENRSDAALGARVVEVLDAALRSARSGVRERVHDGDK